MFTKDWAVFCYHDFGITQYKVVIMTTLKLHVYMYVHL